MAQMIGSNNCNQMKLESEISKTQSIWVRQALNNSDMKAISVNAGIQINW